MTDHEPHRNALRVLLDWIAAALSIGTVLGMVNLAVGVLALVSALCRHQVRPPRISADAELLQWDVAGGAYFSAA